MASEKCEIPAYMMSHKVSEQSPMRSNYLTYSKARSKRSGHRLPKSPSEADTRHLEERCPARKRQGSNTHALVPRKSGSDLCLADVQKHKQRGLLTTTLLNSVHEGWNLDHSCHSAGSSLVSSDELLDEKQKLACNNNQDYGYPLADVVNNHKSTSPSANIMGNEAESHKTGTHLERLLGDRNNVNDFSSLNAAFPPRKLFFMQEYPSTLLGSQAMHGAVDTVSCNKRKSYIDKARHLFGFSHKSTARDKNPVADTCDVHVKLTVKPTEGSQALTKEGDHEMYASYIGDHRRKNRRGRHSNRTGHVMQQDRADFDSELKRQVSVGDNSARKFRSFDSQTVSEMSNLASEYATNGDEERHWDSSGHSYFPSQQESSLHSHQSDHKKVKKERNINDPVVLSKTKKSGQCKYEVDSDEIFESLISMSDKNGFPSKRRAKKKRQRSVTKRKLYHEHSQNEEENKTNISKQYSEHRRHASQEPDNNTVRGCGEYTGEQDKRFLLNNKARRKATLGNEPALSVKDGTHSKAVWTCTKWAKEKTNKDSNESLASRWAYEVYSDVCLNAESDSQEKHIKSAILDNEKAIKKTEILNTKLHEATRDGYDSHVLCGGTMVNPHSDKTRLLAECDISYDARPDVRVAPFLVANHNPLAGDHVDGHANKITRTVWSRVVESQHDKTNLETRDQGMSTAGGIGHRLTSEHIIKMNADDKRDSQESCRTDENFQCGNSNKKIRVLKAKQEIVLEQTHAIQNREGTLKYQDKQHGSYSNHLDKQATASKSLALEPECSVDERLIRTVHSIKNDIESVFDRLNSLDTSQDRRVVKTAALSLKNSVQNVLEQARIIEKNTTAMNVNNAARVVKSALKTLTAFKTTLAAEKGVDDDPNELSYELYKMGKDEYDANYESSFKERDIRIVPIDSKRSSYQLAANCYGGDKVTSDTEDLYTETDDTCCDTLPSETANNHYSEYPSYVSNNEQEEKYSQRTTRVLGQSNTEESEATTVGSAILRKLARSAREEPFSSAESLAGRKSRDKSFEQKFEAMLARFPPNAQEFEITGIPESLTRGRSHVASAMKTKKKRSHTPHSTSSKISTSSKKHGLKSPRTGGDKTSRKATQRQYDNNSFRATPPPSGGGRAVGAAAAFAPASSGAMMQPMLKTKNKPLDSISVASSQSSLAPSQIADLQDAVERVPALKKYREHMLQANRDAEDGENTLRAVKGRDKCSVKESLKTWRGTNEFPVTMRDIQIVYKISSKTSLTEDEESILNAICMQKTEEEIITVPFDASSTSHSSTRKLGPDSSSSGKDKVDDHAAGDQLRDSTDMTNNTQRQEVSEHGGNLSHLPLPATTSQYGSNTNTLLDKEYQLQSGISKEILSNGVSRNILPVCLESDMLTMSKVDANLFQECHLENKFKPAPNDKFETGNFVNSISDTKKDAVATVDPSKECHLTDSDKSISTSRDMQEAKHNTVIQMQASPECHETPGSSNYLKSRDNAEVFVFDTSRSVSYRREERKDNGLVETEERQSSKTAQSDNTETLSTSLVSMLNASIMKLYEEVNKLRVKLESSGDKSSSRSSSNAGHRKNHAHGTAKKHEHAKGSNLKSPKSASSTQSSRASSRGYKFSSEDEDTSSKRGHYFETNPIYPELQSIAKESASKSSLSAVSKCEVGKLCCSYRKYDTKSPEVLSGYYEKLADTSKQEPHVPSDSVYLEYEPEIISPAAYVEYRSENVSPASYMEPDAEDSSVASYADQIGESVEDPELNQPAQYFEKNMAGSAGIGDSSIKSEADSNSYWFNFNTQVIDEPGDTSETEAVSEADKHGSVPAADATESHFVVGQSNVGFVQELLSRDKQSIFSDKIVEYTSNTIPAEAIGFHLEKIAAEINALSAQVDLQLQTNCTSSCSPTNDEESNRKELPGTASQRHAIENCQNWLLTAECCHNDNTDVITGIPQCSSEHQNIDCANCNADEDDDTKAHINSEIETDKIDSSNGNTSTDDGKNKECSDENSALDSKRFEAQFVNSSTKCSPEEVPRIATETMHQTPLEYRAHDRSEPTRETKPPKTPSDREEIEEKDDRDYVPQLHIPRIVQCVRDMFFGSTKAQSKDAHDGMAKPDARSRAHSRTLTAKSSGDSEVTASASRVYSSDVDVAESYTKGYITAWRRLSFNTTLKDDASESVSSPIQQNYIFRRNDSHADSASRASAIMDSLTTTCFQVENTSQKNPHYQEGLLLEKNVNTRHFEGGNMMLSSQPLINYQPIGYLPAFKHVEETDKTIRHYCDAINTKANKKLTELVSGCIDMSRLTSGQGLCSARIYTSTLGKGDNYAHDHKIIGDYDKQPLLAVVNYPDREGWSAPQRQEYFPERQMQGKSTTESLQLSQSDSTVLQRRASYVEHCRFRHKKCDRLDNGPCGFEDLGRRDSVEDRADNNVPKSASSGANGNNSSDNVKRDEGVVIGPGGLTFGKEVVNLRRSSDMFYAHEGLLDSVGVEFSSSSSSSNSSSRIHSSLAKDLFRSSAVSDTSLYKICSEVKSAHYENDGQAKHYKQDSKSDQSVPDTPQTEKATLALDGESKSNNGVTAEGNDGKASTSNGDKGATTDESMEDDERESWYNTTDDESNG